MLEALRALAPRNRTWLAPEVLQTSMMDCGPAALKSLLDGFGRPVNFERLRERCQTDIDGTSLTAIHDAAGRLGLRTQQVMLPKDNLLVAECEASPAIVFLRNPDGLLHFVVLWSVVGPLVQIMDPGRGRVWMPRRAFLDRVATLSVALPAARWRAWATADDFQRPLAAKLRALGIPEARLAALIARADQDPSPAAYAALDAATRFTRNLVEERAIPRGPSALRFLEALFESESTVSREKRKIPPPFWICTPAKAPGQVVSTGAVLLHVGGAADEADDVDEVDSLRGAELAEPHEEHTVLMEHAPQRPAAAQRRAAVRHGATHRLPTLVGEGPTITNVPSMAHANAARMSMWAGPVLAPEVKAELSAPTVMPYKILARMMWAESRGSVVIVTLLLAVSVVTGVLDAVMMRGLASTVGSLTLPVQRIGAILVVATFLVFAFGVEVVQAAIVQRLARGLEARLRVAFLEKLPLLEDRYFRSRPISDMASRAHLLQTLRNVPSFAITLLSSVLNIGITIGVLMWLEPRLKWLALALLVVTLLLPAISYRLLDESLARLRIHGAVLSRFYLDALLGVVPIRVHGAERSVRREHEGLLTEWVRTAKSVETTNLAVLGLQGYLSTFACAALVVSFVARGGDLRALLLLALFAQRLPSYAQLLVSTVRSYPLLKHDALRLFEPLTAAESGVGQGTTPARRSGAVRGVNLAFRGVSAVAGGRDVLSGVDLEIRAGSHVAIVGPSGAGKSSLVSVLLGWLLVSEGTVLVDGRPLDPLRLGQLRAETAWVDPAVQLWNQSLFANLTYGHGEDAFDELERALDSADLHDVIERLPDGLQSPLAEGGARVSGGQGQRVRLGRAMLKRDARLVILDEPFRGLERDKRKVLLARARRLWPMATILYVSHDVGDTLEMDRIVVVNEGRIAEVGTPAELLAAPAMYQALVQADRDAREVVWGRPEWRRIAFEGVDLVETRGPTE